MHGNTYATPSGRKTRHLDTIIAEIVGATEAFGDIVASEFDMDAARPRAD